MQKRYTSLLKVPLWPAGTWPVPSGEMVPGVVGERGGEGKQEHIPLRMFPSNWRQRQGPPTSIVMMSQKGAAAGGMEETHEVIWLGALCNLPCHQGGRDWSLTLPAELFNTQGHTETGSAGQWPDAYLRRSTGFSPEINTPTPPFQDHLSLSPPTGASALLGIIGDG
jgi:hypothetical protein